MSLLGIDVGTTGCKATAFSEEGNVITSEYAEYDIQRPNPGWAELDTFKIWEKIKEVIRKTALDTKSDPIKALAVSSLGEAVVPVKKTRQILGPSILNFDVRGKKYVKSLNSVIDSRHFYRITGNISGNQYSLTKLKWIKEYRPALYKRTYKFLPWGSFISFMLGADPVVDYSLAGRTLLFDINRKTWSDEIIKLAKLDYSKLPDIAPTGTIIGTVSRQAANALGLSPAVPIVTGAHDQCVNAVGCGVIKEGLAVYGMGTFICITPVFGKQREPAVMIPRGLNTEHHAVPGQYVSFIFNQGGSLFKWFRDTFAAKDYKIARKKGEEIYSSLISEIPKKISNIIVLPHFTPTGPPEFISDSYGVLVGLTLETSRGEILKGILEGITFYLKECVELLPPTGIKITEFRVVGGGSKSNDWIQICADIMGKSFTRPKITEAGTLGAAIIAGTGIKIFSSYEDGVESMVKLDRTFEPTPRRQKIYKNRFEKYKKLWPLMSKYLRNN